MIKDDLGVVQRSISPPTNSVTCSAWTTPTTTTRSEGRGYCLCPERWSPTDDQSLRHSVQRRSHHVALTGPGVTVSDLRGEDHGRMSNCVFR